MSKNVQFFVPVLLLIFIAACKKPGDQGPVGPQGPSGPAGPVFYGVIAGRVSVYDPYGTVLSKNLDGITVRLNDKVSSTTDATGYYQFDSVSTGSYKLSVSKPGLGSTIADNTVFVKDTLFQSIKMTARPDFDMLTFKAYTRNGIDSLVSEFPVSKKIRNCVLFASNSRSVGPDNYLMTLSQKLDTISWANPVVFKISPSQFNNMGIAHGQTVYYAIYSGATKDFSAYDDAITGKIIYSALGAPLLDSAIAP